MEDRPQQARLEFEGVSKPDTPTKPAKQQDYIKLFCKRLPELDRSKTVFEKFRDFCEMTYCAYAQQAVTDPSQAEQLEARYMQIVGTYQDKDTVRAYPELLAWAALAIADKQDFFGTVASQLELLDSRNSQFFTPYPVSKMMAMMTLGDVGPTIEEKGFITVQEPASGAGGMILAVADVLEGQGYNPAEHLLVQATDISPLCYHMTYVQLTLRGIPAAVIRGNTLSLEQFESVWTPQIATFFLKHGRLFDEPTGDTPAIESIQAPEPVPFSPPVYQVGEHGQLGLF